MSQKHKDDKKSLQINSIFVIFFVIFELKTMLDCSRRFPNRKKYDLTSLRRGTIEIPYQKRNKLNDEASVSAQN